ncbi:hypothetical protein GF407_14575 [candidate division KSB1 bacterium]|nr:hypothetical protein [candidate division KSB1 bacterium]
MKCCVLCFLICISFLATAHSRDEIALVIKCDGNAQYRQSEQDWNKLGIGKRLEDGDEIKTGKGAQVTIVFIDDKSLMKIREESQLILHGKREEKNIIKKIGQQLGQLWFKVTNQETQLQVETPSGIAAVKGTEFYSLVDDLGNTTIIGISGIVELFNSLGRVQVGPSQTGKAGKKSIPVVEKSEESMDWGTDSGTLNELEIEFENENGEKKTLKLQYK